MLLLPPWLQKSASSRTMVKADCSSSLFTCRRVTELQSTYCEHAGKITPVLCILSFYGKGKLIVVSQASLEVSRRHMMYGIIHHLY